MQLEGRFDLAINDHLRNCYRTGDRRNMAAVSDCIRVDKPIGIIMGLGRMDRKVNSTKMRAETCNVPPELSVAVQVVRVSQYPQGEIEVQRCIRRPSAIVKNGI